MRLIPGEVEFYGLHRQVWPDGIPRFTATGYEAAHYAPANFDTSKILRVGNEPHPDRATTISLLIDYAGPANMTLESQIYMLDDQSHRIDPTITGAADLSQLLFKWTMPYEPAWERIVFPDDKYDYLNMDLLHGKDVLSWELSSYSALYPPGDVNHDGLVNALDIDAIYDAIYGRPGVHPGADVDGSGTVDQADVTYELNHIVLTNYGDANLDTCTDFLDFQILLDHWQATGGWAAADFNGDGVADFLDFQKLLDYWNPGGWNFAPSQVPEPTTVGLLLLGAIGVLRRRRK